MEYRRLQPKYLLGVADEPVTDIHKDSVSWSTSKIGGIPDLINLDLPTPICRLCQQLLAFILQIYAPLEGSRYHRTLYLFGCVNKACWGRSESWTIFRGKKLQEKSRNKDRDYAMRLVNDEALWHESDDWGEDEDAEDYERNLELASPLSSSPCSGAQGKPSSSYDDAGDHCYSPGSNNLHQSSDASLKTNTKSKNANNQNLNLVLDEQGNPRDIYAKDFLPIVENMWKMQLGDNAGGNGFPEGAVGISRDMDASAEIESPDEGTIAMDTPMMLSPESIASIFNSSDLVQSPTTKLLLSPWFISVVDEPIILEKEVLSEHERELLTHYQRQEGVNINQLYKLANQGDTGGEGETYERIIPKHGDRGFHKMSKRMAACPEQLLRYSRDPGSQAILINTSKVEDYDPGKCLYCHKSRCFEVQILPSAIEYFRVESCLDPVVEFGTVIIYTCVDDCWKIGDSYREEKIVVQPDPDDIWYKAIESLKVTTP